MRIYGVRNKENGHTVCLTWHRKRRDKAYALLLVANHEGSSGKFEMFMRKYEPKPIAMNLNEYQQKAMTTCMPSCNNFTYMFLNLVAEMGEFSGKIAKQIRKGNIEISQNQKMWHSSEKFTVDDVVVHREELEKELGDILWQVAGLTAIMGWDLEDIAQKNLDKLASRQKRGVIDGSGDNR